MVGMVAERGDTIVGFMVYELFPKSIKILCFHVHPDYKRLGIGSQMMEKLKQKLSKNKYSFLLVQVPESETIAHLFLHSQGFKAVKVERRAYLDPDEDAYWFRFDWTQALEAQKVTKNEVSDVCDEVSTQL